MHPVKRNPDGSMAFRTFKVPMHQVVIDLLTGKGKKMTPDIDGVPLCHRWYLRSPILDPALGEDGNLYLKSAVFPRLDYNSTNEEAYVTFEMYDIDFTQEIPDPIYTETPVDGAPTGV